jgi:hypothetical protein
MGLPVGQHGTVRIGADVLVVGADRRSGSVAVPIAGMKSRAKDRKTFSIARSGASSLSVMSPSNGHRLRSRGSPRLMHAGSASGMRWSGCREAVMRAIFVPEKV